MGSGHKELHLQNALKALHETASDAAEASAEAPEQAQQRDTILVVDKEPAVRNLICRLLKISLPDCETVSFSERNQAIEAVSGELKNRLILIFSNVGIPHEDAISFMLSLRGESGEDLARTPIVLASGLPDFVEQGEASPESKALVDAGTIDSVLAKPFGPRDMERAVARAINRRLAILHPSEHGLAPGELEAREEAFERFREHSLALIEFWREGLGSIDHADSQAILDDIPRLIQLLERLKDVDSLVEAELGEVSHDIRNVITFPLALLEMLLEDEASNLSYDDRKNLKTMLAQSKALVAEDSKIAKARYGKIAWQDLLSDALEDNGFEKIEHVEGRKIAVVDDRKHNIDISERAINDAGGETIRVEKTSGIEAFIAEAEQRGNTVDVILLDHQLDDGKHGYEYIDRLIKAYPKAKIIVHSAMGLALDRQADNPYYAHEGYRALHGERIEIVSKHDFHAIGGVIRRKVDPEGYYADLGDELAAAIDGLEALEEGSVPASEAITNPKMPAIVDGVSRTVLFEMADAPRSAMASKEDVGIPPEDGSTALQRLLRGPKAWRWIKRLIAPKDGDHHDNW